MCTFFFSVFPSNVGSKDDRSSAKPLPLTYPWILINLVSGFGIFMVCKQTLNNNNYDYQEHNILH